MNRVAHEPLGGGCDNTRSAAMFDLDDVASLVSLRPDSLRQALQQPRRRPRGLRPSNTLTM